MMVWHGVSMVLEHFSDLLVFFFFFWVNESEEEEVEVGGVYKSLMAAEEVGFFFFFFWYRSLFEYLVDLKTKSKLINKENKHQIG